MENYQDNINGHPKRLKIRIRWYNNTFGAIERPVLELKIRENHLGSKLSFPLISFVLDKNFSREKIAYAFQNSVVEILVKKSLLACQKKQVKTLLVGGGVAANSLLRKKLQAQGQARGIQVFYPPVSFCIDNAAMIAGLAYHTVKKNRRINRSSKERRKLCTTLN